MIAPVRDGPLHLHAARGPQPKADVQRLGRPQNPYGSVAGARNSKSWLGNDGDFPGRVEPHVAKNDFVAVPEFTIANITGFFTLRIIGALGMDITAAFPATAAWFAIISTRPAFQI